MNVSGSVQRQEIATGEPVWGNVVDALSELYRAQGYAVESGATLATGGSAEGFDLKLRKDDDIVLVQCTQAGTRPLPHNHVHRLLGAVVKQAATAAVLVTDGEFTDYARTSAGKLGQIQLIDGTQLQAMLGDSYTGLPHAAARIPLAVLAAQSRMAGVPASVVVGVPDTDASATPAVEPRLVETRVHEAEPATVDVRPEAVPQVSARIDVPMTRGDAAEATRDDPSASTPATGVTKRFRVRTGGRHAAKPPSRLTKPLAGVLACAVAMWTMQGAMGSFESGSSIAAPSVATMSLPGAANAAPPAPVSPSTVTVASSAPAPSLGVADAQPAGRPIEEAAQALPMHAPTAAAVSEGIASTPTPDSVPPAAAATLRAAPASLPSPSVTGALATGGDAATVPRQRLPARVDVAAITITPRRASKKNTASGVEDDFRDHERRNAEAMRVLEKNTPAIGYALPDRSSR